MKRPTRVAGEPGAYPGMLTQMDEDTLENSNTGGRANAADVTTNLATTMLNVMVVPSDTGITQLTGDVTAGPGSGSQAATLANTGVTAGSYTSANITVDAKGRIIAASNGTASVGGNANIIILQGNATGTYSASGFTASNKLLCFVAGRPELYDVQF